MSLLMGGTCQGLFFFFPFEGDLLGSRKQKTLPGEETDI